jgi:hypothetical protein
MSPEACRIEPAEGFVRVPSAFTREQAAAMASRVWQTLEHEYGVVRDDPASWHLEQAWGLQSLKRHSVFEPIGGEKLTAALDAWMGRGGWQRPKDWGQMLVTFPTPGPWTLPHRVWHTDFPYHTRYAGSSGRIGGALVLTFVSDVPPRSGGTLVVAGSPAVVRRFLEGRPRAKRENRQEKMKTVRQALMQSDPWLADLASDAPQPDRIERFMERGHEIGGVPVRVVELTGRAGDVVIGHPWLLHAGAPNCGDGPRIMRVQRIGPAAVSRRAPRASEASPGTS